MFRLKAINRDYQVKIPDIGPTTRDGPYRAGDQLDLDTHSVEQGQ
jgi:hypothetical protein